MTEWQDCVHNLYENRHGLCEECQRDYEEDPQAWVEYGRHPAGLANWEWDRQEQLYWEEQARANHQKTVGESADQNDIPF